MKYAKRTRLENGLVVLALLILLFVLTLLNSCTSCSESGRRESIKVEKPVLHTFVVITSNGTDTITAKYFSNGSGAYRRNIYFYDDLNYLVGQVVTPDDLNLTIRMIK
jgi:hypothetical protein